MFHFKLLSKSNTWHLSPVNIKSEPLNTFFLFKKLLLGEMRDRTENYKRDNPVSGDTYSD